jgi:hypothetical protein
MRWNCGGDRRAPDMGLQRRGRPFLIVDGAFENKLV